jgi:CheY-like chemotaxis protein
MARILVIEDDQVTPLAVSTYLKHVGYDVLTACNGLEGVEVFRSCPNLIDLVLTDLRMPVMTGNEGVHQIRETIDEVGYVPLAELGAEFLFQVVAERAEKAAVIITTNLPFSEWTQVIPNARLCKVLLDRITDRAHILETGKDSYRFRRTNHKKKEGEKQS